MDFGNKMAPEGKKIEELKATPAISIELCCRVVVSTSLETLFEILEQIFRETTEYVVGAKQRG